MTKTFEIQIELAKAIAAEAKKRLPEMQERGCVVDATKMEALVKQAEHINECDEKKGEMRTALSEYTAELNEKFLGFKDDVTELKRMIKGHYPQSSWKQFGIMDKQ